MEFINTPAYLRSTMERLGMVPEDLRDLLGVHEKTIQAWLSGRRPIPLYAGTCMWLMERVCRMEAFYQSVDETKH